MESNDDALKSNLLFKIQEEHYQQQLRNEIMNRMRRLNVNLNKTLQEMNRANNALYLGRITKMKRQQVDEWETYIDRLMETQARIHEQLRKYDKLEDELYICCSDEIRDFFLKMGAKLKETNPSWRFEDIYSALILTSYSLLSEVYDDMFTLQHLDDKAFDIYIQITSGDIMHNGSNLSSEIRRFLLGLKPEVSEGGETRRLKTKTYKRKSTRRKSKAKKHTQRGHKKRNKD